MPDETDYIDPSVLLPNPESWYEDEELRGLLNNLNEDDHHLSTATCSIPPRVEAQPSLYLVPLHPRQRSGLPGNVRLGLTQWGPANDAKITE